MTKSISAHQVSSTVRRYSYLGNLADYAHDVHDNGLYVGTLRPVRYHRRGKHAEPVSINKLSFMTIKSSLGDPGDEIYIKARGRVVAKLRNEDYE